MKETEIQQMNNLSLEHPVVTHLTTKLLFLLSSVLGGLCFSVLLDALHVWSERLNSLFFQRQTNLLAPLGRRAELRGHKSSRLCRLLWSVLREIQVEFLGQYTQVGE